MQRLYALVDCNNFYASCERVFRPDLVGKPVVVLSNNDGCVIARSNEAKALDIPMGAPAFKFQELFDRQGVSVFSANFALYGDMSMRVMNILSEHCPDMEIYSIDEAFMLFEGFEYFDLQAYCLTLSRKVHRATGIPISIGIASTKALSKVANRIAKKYPKETQGVYHISSEEKRVKALKWLKVEDIWGIGRQHAKRLQALGVVSAYDFTQLHDQYIKKYLSVVGLRLKLDLEGNAAMKLDKKKPKQNIATTRSFDKMYTTKAELRERVATFAVSCAEKLRRQKSCCQSIMVFVHTNGYRKDLPQYSRNILVKIPFATNSSIEITKYALLGLEKIYKEGFAYKKAGVVIMDFSPEEITQQTLFAQANPKHKKIMQTLDDINNSIGTQKIKLAVQSPGRMWKMRQEKLSPRYSTKLSEIISINAIK